MRESTDPRSETAARYRASARVEAVGMSPTYEGWAAGIAEDPGLIAVIDTLPAPRRQPNLVFAAARTLGAASAPYPVFRRWLLANWAAVRAVALVRTTQTNEAARCAPMLPILARLPGPLALLEVGASAGLCLYPDRYSYRYSRHPTGDPPTGDPLRIDPPSGPSTVTLDCEIRGPVPVPDRVPEVVWRAGIDLNPLDAADPDDLRWLDALVWPEHHDRRARLAAAARIAAAEPPRLVRGDLVDELPALAASAPAGATLVVLHTAVLAYLDPQSRDRFGVLVRALPGHWISCEGRGVAPGVPDPAPVPGEAPPDPSDFVLALDGIPVAGAHPHGRRVSWSGRS